MIKHRSDFFGFRSLTRFHGSAVAKGLVPALTSTAILALAIFVFGRDLDGNDIDKPTIHPYPIQVLIVFFTFLITFRANFAYGRYWEGATAVHHMLSKWLDVGMNLAAYHYQCGQYDDGRPPSFGKHAKLQNLTREREREQTKINIEELQNTLETSMKEQKEEKRDQKVRFYNRLLARSMHTLKRMGTRNGLDDDEGSNVADKPKASKVENQTKQEVKKPTRHVRRRTSTKNINLADPEYGNYAEFSNYRSNVPHRSLMHSHSSDASLRPSQRQLFSGDVSDSTDDEHSDPSLFLQECAHLLSLLSAVSMSTLRRDVEGIEPPLVEHIPGRPWPPMDPDKLGDEIRVQYHEDSKFWRVTYFLLGLSRGARHRTLYNAARPFRVLGGVSDSEIQQLKEARGIYAKVSLCSLWVQELISREYLAGSTGGVAPPIISRLYQFLSDGNIGYNQCRKIAYVPFPFPHAQMTVFFICVIIFVFPVLFYSFVNNEAYGLFLNFITVLCFVGLHEVARELEAPFENVPNDIPLNNFQAQFNEALIQMYAGFHPDSWWEITDEVKAMELPSLEEDHKEEGEQPVSLVRDEAPIKEDEDPGLVREELQEIANTRNGE